METELKQMSASVIASHFLGSQTNKLDTKGRLSVPAHFRRALEETGHDGVFCCPALTGPVIDCGGRDLIDLMIAAVAHLDQFSTARQDLELYYTSHTQPLAFDAAGRITLPHPMKTHLGMPVQVAVMGLGGRFQIREMAAFEAVSARAKAHAAGEREIIEARSLPSTAGRTDMNNLPLAGQSPLGQSPLGQPHSGQPHSGQPHSGQPKPGKGNT